MGSIKVGKKEPKTVGQEAPEQKKMSILPTWEKEAIIEEAVKIAKEQILSDLQELGLIGGEDNTNQGEDASDGNS